MVVGQHDRQNGHGFGHGAVPSIQSDAVGCLVICLSRHPGCRFSPSYDFAGQVAIFTGFYCLSLWCCMLKALKHSSPMKGTDDHACRCGAAMGLSFLYWPLLVEEGGGGFYVIPMCKPSVRTLDKILCLA
jgi:hypothetical protein